MRAIPWLVLLATITLPSCSTMALWGKTGCCADRDVTQAHVKREASAEATNIAFCRTDDCQRAIALSYRYLSGELVEGTVPRDDRRYHLVLEPRSNVLEYRELVTDASAIEALSWEYQPGRTNPAFLLDVAGQSWTGDVQLTWSEAEPEWIADPAPARPIAIRETTIETSYLQVLWRGAVTPFTLVADLTVLPGLLLFPVIWSL